MNDQALGISTEEYAARRACVLEALDGAAAVVLAGSAGPTLQGRWFADPMFRYLTGLDYEGNAAVLFDPTAEDPARRITLFLKPRDIEIERWDGARAALDSALKAQTGFTHIKRTPYLPGLLTEAARRSKRLACLHQFASYTADLSPDLEIFQKITQRIPGVALEDRTQLLPSMRAVKSPAELALIERAVVATAAGFDACFKAVAPGLNESDVADLLQTAYRELSCRAGLHAHRRGPASTARSSTTATTTRQSPRAISSSWTAPPRIGGYASDVTRTLPASGTFSADQREVYEIVLAVATGRHRRGRARGHLHRRRHGRPRGHRERRLRRGLHPRHQPPRRHRGPRRHSGRAPQARHGHHHRARHLSARPRVRCSHRGRHPHHRDREPRPHLRHSKDAWKRSKRQCARSQRSARPEGPL